MWSCLAISVLSHPWRSSSVICLSRGPKRTDVSFIPPFPSLTESASAFVFLDLTTGSIPPKALHAPPSCPSQDSSIHLATRLQFSGKKFPHFAIVRGAASGSCLKSLAGWGFWRTGCGKYRKNNRKMVWQVLGSRARGERHQSCPMAGLEFFGPQNRTTVEYEAEKWEIRGN